MIARIEQVTTTEFGELALFVSFWENGQRVNAEQFAIAVPDQLPTAEVIEEWRNPKTGLRETVLDAPVPDQPSQAEWAIISKIGLKEERRPYSAGQWFADFAIARINGFAGLHRASAGVLAFADSLDDAAVLRIAAEKERYWGQRRDNAAANGDAALAAQHQLTVDLCVAARLDLALARATLVEMVRLERLILTPAEWWPAHDRGDPSGLLALAEVAGLRGAEIEV